MATPLNPSQHQAAHHKDGPLVVFAGAGSGKTRIITHRIANLIESGVRPWQILAVTFTNKAAEEMRVRVQAIEPTASSCHIATFHSSATRWLREFADKLGFTSNFTIYDDSDSKNLLKSLVKAQFPKEEVTTVVGEMRSFIHKAKSMGIFPHALDDSPLKGHMPIGGKAIYSSYQESLFSANAMDFSDLLLNALLLLRNNEEVRTKLQDRYRYILVDEFQDTNHSQYEIISILAAKHKNLFVVGDDDQSIYSWRGAHPYYILEFCDRFEGATKVTLEQNYRSSQNIIGAANGLIRNNNKRSAKNLFSENDPGPKVLYIEDGDGALEAHSITSSILNEKHEFALEETAVFYRTNAQSRALEEAFHRENIPFTIYGALEFYARAEIKDIMAYLRLVANPQDNVSALRVVNVPPRGLGARAVEQVIEQAEAENVSFVAACKLLADANVPRIASKLRAFTQVLAGLAENIEQMTIADAVAWLIDELDYLKYLQKKFPDQVQDKTENLQELMASIASFEAVEERLSVSQWLQSVSLNPGEEDRDTKGVSLMTLHAAKGLEFDRVYISGVEEGLLPHKNSTDRPDLVEEERRLLYVGITRARKKLTLLSANLRAQYNTYTSSSPSRFIYEIPEDFIEGTRSEAASEMGGWDSLADSEPVEDVDIGDKVFHPTYGSGTVQRLDEQPQSKKAIVYFRDWGKRKISISQLQK